MDWREEGRVTLFCSSKLRRGKPPEPGAFLDETYWERVAVIPESDGRASPRFSVVLTQDPFSYKAPPFTNKLCRKCLYLKAYMMGDGAFRIALLQFQTDKRRLAICSL